MTSANTGSYSNPFTVKLPLMRVAHASDQENAQHMNHLKTTLDKQAQQNRNLIANSMDGDDSLSRDISSKGVPTSTARQGRVN